MSRPLILKLLLAFAAFSIAIVVWIMLSIASIDRAHRAEFESMIKNVGRENETNALIETAGPESNNALPARDNSEVAL